MAIFYIVATPIGNLEDMTLRAVSILNSVDLILAENTRVTRVLLNKYNIQTKLISYHQHSDAKKIQEIANLLKDGKNLALVSDAGTPGINDPGNFLINQLLQETPDLKIVPIPGPNAAVAALSVSGFLTDRFVYLGFPPHKKGRQTFFKKISEIKETVVFCESKHRILKCLKELREIAQIGNRPMLVAREITKQFETFYRGTAYDIELTLQKNKTNLLGEFVVVISKTSKIDS